MSHVFGRNTRLQPPVVSGGEGCYLIDSTGKRYFDGSGGAAVSCLGHGDAEVTEAIKAQLDQVAFAHTGFFTSQPAEQLADLLIANAPEGIEQVYFVSGGSEAVESALKLARQYFVERGEPGRSRVIARRQSYHGNTLGALAVGGNQWRREQFAPILIESSYVSPCFEYRGRGDDETALEYGQRVANELETEIQRLGPDSVMAFIAEPVVGATLGAVPPVEGYFKRVREICDKHGVLLILDEVMCGMGRTGSLFASEQEGISPDIICIAKGLGGGYQPIGAMMCSKTIFETIKRGSGFFQHGHTYIAHPTACAAGLAVLRAILQRGLVAQVNLRGNQLMSALNDTFGQHAHIGDIRGRGLFLAMELVADRDSKEPFDPELRLNQKFKAAAFDAGLACYPMGGTIDGKHGDHILLAPPYIMGENQVGEIVEKLAIALEKVLD
ncbi:MAG: aspartate aminotransferase family protein [Rhizobiaceae bacterium]|nr:aspartate aminotransferase family protein [Rhizobiaceae bacterium]